MNLSHAFIGKTGTKAWKIHILNFCSLGYRTIVDPKHHLGGGTPKIFETDQLFFAYALKIFPNFSMGELKNVQN